MEGSNKSTDPSPSNPGPPDPKKPKWPQQLLFIVLPVLLTGVLTYFFQEQRMEIIELRSKNVIERLQLVSDDCQGLYSSLKGDYNILRAELAEQDSAFRSRKQWLEYQIAQRDSLIDSLGARMIRKGDNFNALWKQLKKAEFQRDSLIKELGSITPKAITVKQRDSILAHHYPELIKKIEILSKVSAEIVEIKRINRKKINVRINLVGAAVVKDSNNYVRLKLRVFSDEKKIWLDYIEEDQGFVIRPYHIFSREAPLGKSRTMPWSMDFEHAEEKVFKNSRRVIIEVSHKLIEKPLIITSHTF